MPCSQPPSVRSPPPATSRPPGSSRNKPKRSPLRVAAGAGHADLATKADIAELKGDVAALRTETKADLAELETRLRSATQADIAGLRAEIGTIRWAIGLIAAFLFTIGLRVFGSI